MGNVEFQTLFFGWWLTPVLSNLSFFYFQIPQVKIYTFSFLKRHTLKNWSIPCINESSTLFRIGRKRFDFYEELLWYIKNYFFCFPNSKKCLAKIFCLIIFFLESSTLAFVVMPLFFHIFVCVCACVFFMGHGSCQTKPLLNCPG